MRCWLPWPARSNSSNIGSSRSNNRRRILQRPHQPQYRVRQLLHLPQADFPRDTPSPDRFPRPRAARSQRDTSFPRLHLHQLLPRPNSRKLCIKERPSWHISSCSSLRRSMDGQPVAVVLVRQRLEGRKEHRLHHR